MYDLDHYGELDKDYRKRAGLRVAMFGITAAITLLCAGSSAFLVLSSNKLQKDSYESYIEDARSHPEIEGQINNYEEAIALNPANGVAYLELLNQVYLLDDIFTPEEDE